MAHVPGQVAEAVPEVVDNGEGEDKLGGEDEHRPNAESLDHAQVVRVRAWKSNCSQGNSRQNSRLHQTRNPEQQSYIVSFHFKESVLTNLWEMESMLVSWNL